jgi:hypothetical protein
MKIRQISEWWWMLDVTFDERRLVFFGQTEGEVLGKYRAWVRAWEMEKIK